MFSVTVDFKVKADKTEDFEALMMPLTNIGQQEQGCDDYRLLRQAGDSQVYTLIERWQSREAHDVHFGRPETQAILPQLISLLEETPHGFYDEVAEAQEIQF